MNINSKYLNEARTLEKRWAVKGLLDGLTDRASKAPLMECQRLSNEMNYFSLVKGNKVVAQIPTKCSFAAQIDEIDAFLRANGILDENTKVIFSGYVPK